MNDSTTNEISILFQELIVSKIKDEIDLLKKVIDDVKGYGEELDTKVDKLPKVSSIKKLVEEETTNITSHIDQLVSKSKTEKYLKDIIEYLKKQYGFAEKKTLCEYLDELSGAFGSKIDNIINGQSTLDEKYVAISSTIEEFKTSVVSCIETNQIDLLGEIQQYHGKFVNYHNDTIERLGSIIEKSNEGISCLSGIGVGLVGINECLNRIETNENTLLANLGDDSDIVSILNRICSNIGYEINSDNTESVKSDLNEVNSVLQKVLEYCRNQEDRFNAYIEENKRENEKKDQKINVLSILNAISIIGIVTILIMQFI